MLESEEIKQLLQNNSEFEKERDTLPDEEKEEIVKVIKGPLDLLAEALSKIISDSCEIADVGIDIVKGSLLKETLDEEAYFMQDVIFNDQSDLFSTLIVDIATAKKIAAIMLEEINSEEKMSDSEKSAWSEATAQMMMAFGKGLSKQLGVKFQTAIDKKDKSEIDKKENIIQVTFTLKAGTNIDTTMYYLISYELMNNIISRIKTNVKSNPESKKEEKADEVEEVNATVQPIRFEEFDEQVPIVGQESIDLLMDLQLQISVELGKVKKTIKDILQFTEGTIVELERLAGENVDVLISGKVIAKGEVVVVDQNFGVRITHIVTPDKRV
jgi:flagellar motor switch protein FliN/FliY